MEYLVIGLQLYREMKWKCKHSLNYNVCVSVDSTTLADGYYKLIPEPEEGISKDPGNVTGYLTEAPSSGSESFSVDISNPKPTSEGKSRT
jgi:hypothetical protein